MKTQMSGLFQNYRKMFKILMNWDTGESDPRYYGSGTHPVLGNEEGHYLYNAGYALSDAGYHGWKGEPLKNENSIFQKIELSYQYLLKSLAEAIGYEFPEDQDIWKYHLKDLNTDDVLKFANKKEGETEP